MKNRISKGKNNRIAQTGEGIAQMGTKAGKKIRNRSWITLALLGALTLGVLAKPAMPVYGEEAAQREVVTDILHKHTGNPGEKGGCYQKEIPHVHQGNESQGGACYQTTVEHMHQGDPDAGTGCYTHAVYHVHEGNGESGGGCYEAVFHTHEADCYENKICTIRYTGGEVISTSVKDCDEHGPADHELAYGTASHVNCSLGEVEVQMEYCKECGIMTYSYHTYPDTVCGMDEETPTGYERVCGKEETTIEEYEAECGHEQGSVTGYQISCPKTAEGYDRNCGLEEGKPCGRLIVTNETEDCQEKVTVSVRVEDLSGGRLAFENPPFVWYDAAGNCIGKGERIQVTKNGSYTVEVKLQNRDVDEKGLKSSITVDNILEKSDASPSPEGNATPSPSQKEDPLPSESEAPSDPKPSSGIQEEPDLTQSTASPTPQAMPQEEDGGNRGGMAKKEGHAGNVEAADGTGTRPKETAPVIQKESQKKTLTENLAPLKVPVEVKKTGFWQGVFASPAVRVVTIAAGTLLLLAGVLLLLLYFSRSAALYNDDGEGRFLFLGRCRIRLEEEGYAVTISEKQEEKAYTNRYRIKTGLFRLGKGQQELLVYKDSKRITVRLDKEMIFLI